MFYNLVTRAYEGSPLLSPGSVVVKCKSKGSSLDEVNFQTLDLYKRVKFFSRGLYPNKSRTSYSRFYGVLSSKSTIKTECIFVLHVL